MDIILNWKYIVGGLGVLFILSLWWNNILLEEIWEDCMYLAKENGNLKTKIEVLKAGRR
jgi:hypothetical protein